MSFYMGFTLVFIVVLILAYICTAVWYKYARTLDKPNHRKEHTQPVVTMGGVVVYGVYWLSIVFVTFAFKLIIREQIPLFVASTIVFITGLLDDKYDITPLQKSIGILIAATIVYWTTDFKIYSLLEIWLGRNMMTEIFGYILTLIWIYFVTNAFNLIDGLDGLSTGISIISLTSIAFISYVFSPASVFVLTHMIVLLIASLLGFLPHNYYPAKLFIGDTGILFIGFLISVFCLMSVQRSNIVAIATPIVIVAVPLLDTVTAFLRRLIHKRPISQADKLHMHHRLMMRGNPHSRSVVMMYGIATVYAAGALLLTLVDMPVDRDIVLGLIVLFTIFLIDFLNLLDLKHTLFYRERSVK